MDSARSTRRSPVWIWMGKVALLAVATLIAWKYTVRPFEEHEERIEREYAALGEQIEAARRSIKEVQALEQQSRSVASELGALYRGKPEGSALVWLPVRVKEQFRSFNYPDARIRMSTVREIPDLPGYTRIAWKLELPVQRTSQDIRSALLAILEIEAADPFVRVEDIVIGPDPADSSRHVALATISLLAPRP